MKLSLMNIVENAALKALNSGRMIAFYVPPRPATYIQSLFNDVPGDVVEPKHMHITLGLVRNGENSDIFKVLSNVAPHLNKFSAEINEFGVFPPSEHNENKFVLYANPKSNEIFDIHQIILDELKKNKIEIDNGSFDFKPHITIKYCEKEPNIDVPIKEKIILDKIYLAQGEKRKGFKLS